MRNELRNNILLLLPTSPNDSINKIELSELLNESKYTVASELKKIRLSGVPLLWNRGGIYIDYNPGAIRKQNEIIENMKIGFNIGMSNIQEVFNNIIEQGDI